jgi:hypothetical protein
MIKLADVFKWIFFGGIGAVLTLIIQRMRSSLSLIQWQANFLAIANKGWAGPAAGTLEVKLNGENVGYLWQSTVIITNESGRDLTDFEVIFRFTEGQVITHHEVTVVGQEFPLDMSTQFLEIAMRAAGFARQETRTEAEDTQLTSALCIRGMAVPVLNRDQSIEAKFVLTTAEEPPFVTVSSPSAGIKVAERPYYPPFKNEVWGISMVHALRAGIPINVALVAALYYFYDPSPLTLVVVIMLVVVIIMTTVQSVFGLVALRFIRFIRSFLSA